jgi:hypothetical protein
MRYLAMRSLFVSIVCAKWHQTLFEIFAIIPAEKRTVFPEKGANFSSTIVDNRSTMRSSDVGSERTVITMLKGKLSVSGSGF